MMSSEASARGATRAELAVHGRQVSCRQRAGRQICTPARLSARAGCILYSPATQAVTQRNAGQISAQLAVPQRATLREQLPLGLQLDSYPSLGGNNVLVTGSGRGIGYHTARLLSLLGAEVYVTDLCAAAIAAAVADIKALQPRGGAHAAPAMDLGSLRSIEQFVEEFSSQLGGAPLHTLVNNAGANFMGRDPWYTAAGVAGIPQVNVLGPFALTQRLRPALWAAGSSRIVTVASVMHRKTSLPLELDEFFTDWWDGGAYRNCKLASVLLTGELQRRWGENGVVAMAVDPGAVHSNIWDASKTLGKPPGSWVLSTLFAPVWDAAATSVHAAATAEPEPAGYYARGLFAAPAMSAAPGAPAATLAAPLPILDWPLRNASAGRLAADIRRVPVAPAAHDQEVAAALWDACCERASL